MSFEILIVSNFEISTTFDLMMPKSEMLCSQEEKCSAIYASPLVQKKINFLSDKADSDIVIEVAENQEESVNESMSEISEHAGGPREMN